MRNIKADYTISGVTDKGVVETNVWAAEQSENLLLPMKLTLIIDRAQIFILDGFDDMSSEKSRLSSRRAATKASLAAHWRRQWNMMV